MELISALSSEAIRVRVRLELISALSSEASRVSLFVEIVRVECGRWSTDDLGSNRRQLSNEQRSLPPQRQDTNLKVGSNAGSFIVSSR